MLEEVKQNILAAINDCAKTVVITESCHVAKECAEAVKELVGAYILLSNQED